jgi:predicted ATPase
LIKLNSIRIKNFKSFQDITIENLDLLTVLIGVNGAGKSNVLSVLDFVSNSLKIGINSYLNTINKIDLKDFLYNWDVNKIIEIQLHFIDYISKEKYVYEFGLEHKNEHHFSVSHETIKKDNIVFVEYDHAKNSNNLSNNLKLSSCKNNSIIELNIYNFLSNIISYNFYHSVLFSKRTSICNMDNCKFLNQEYTNFVAVLYNIKNTSLDNYLVIKNIIKMLIPSFEDFTFEEEFDNIRLKIKLYSSHLTNDLSLLSEGTIRILVLAVLLNLPIKNRPAILILEEPEIALHHNVLDIVADLIDRYAKESQIMLVTQSPNLLNKVNIDNLYVLKLNKELTYSYVEKVDKDRLSIWLKQYKMGELWMMNLIGGNPF